MKKPENENLFFKLEPKRVLFGEIIKYFSHLQNDAFWFLIVRNLEKKQDNFFFF